MIYRHLRDDEIRQLINQSCECSDWTRVLVAENFRPDFVRLTRFSGEIRLGTFEKSYQLAGGLSKHSGLYMVTLHNVVVGDDCCIENIANYISNYEIGEGTYIVNVDVIITDGESSFGNGVEVSVLNETGGREVMIYDRLSSQQAYMMALYRHSPELISGMRRIVLDYVDTVRSSVGKIGPHVTIVDVGYIKNVKIGPHCKIEGASHLKNGSINSNESAPVHIGVNVIADDFIISSGTDVEDATIISHCFVGQNCRLGHAYSVTDSLFFSNCRGENGEACAIFAGPFTVTHHKSTLLIAGMFSFMNAGSGSNQSNHMYKLGPFHQGIMERGAKTTSDSYILWPARVGAFSLVMGRHTDHQDTSDLPFSYLIEQHSTTYIFPGANLKSVGTIRDAQKWPRRDTRKDPDRLDIINYNLLSPYTAQKMLNGCRILKDLRDAAGSQTREFDFQGGRIKRSSLEKGLSLYDLALKKFVGNSVISRINSRGFEDLESLRKILTPCSDDGKGDWLDMAGLIAPKVKVEQLIFDIETGVIKSADELGRRFSQLHENYYEYEWNWVYEVMKSEPLGIDCSEITVEQLKMIVENWRSAVVSLDEILIEDARKEFSLSMMTSFGADGDLKEKEEDFTRVRGCSFEDNLFVCNIRNHIRVKSQLAEDTLAKISVLHL